MQDIYVGDVGKGIPLVLIHGFLGSSDMWRLQIDFFKKYFRVITPDIPGFGKSSKAKPCKSIQAIAKILSKCFEEKKIKEFYLLGHSMGGMIAQEIIKINKKKVLKLILYSTGAIGEMPGRFETIKRSREKLKKKGLKFMAENIAKTWFVKGKNAKYYGTCIKVGQKSSLKAVDNALVAFQNWNGENNLKKIKSETLLVWGDKDKSYNFDQILIFKKNIKRSKLIVFRNHAHNIHLENSNQFNLTIKNFLL